jgi:transcriptional regulator GlxA family with amidase domain
VSLTRKPLQFDGVTTLHPHATIANAKSPDLILIPSSGPRVLELLDELRCFVPWIQACSSRGARVVGMCTGAFLLAETGLLDGRTATTHWNFADLFRQRYPKVILRADQLIGFHCEVARPGLVG